MTFQYSLVQYLAIILLVSLRFWALQLQHRCFRLLLPGAAKVFARSSFSLIVAPTLTFPEDLFKGSLFC